jgi:hypothetical protein
MVRELLNGNVSLGKFVRVTLRAAIEEPRRVFGLKPKVPLAGSSRPVRRPRLGLRPGEEVVVRSKEEIAVTLNEKGFDRGLWFDEEMLPYCGRRLRVRQRISRFIDEHTGRMIELKSDAVTLDGAVCSAEHSPVRWFCPRLSYPYWRESWLRRPEFDFAADAPAERSEETKELEQPVEAVFHHPVPPEPPS